MNFRKNTNDNDIYNDVYLKNEYNIDQFNSDDIVIDIGGHVGFFSLKAWDNGSREVHCFEPFKQNYKSLFQNVANTTIKIYNLAVRGNYKYKTLDVDVGDNIKSQEIKNYGGLCLKEGSSVNVITLQDIIEQINKPIKLLKLDCEGSEFSIIMESPDYIFENIENIVGEIHNCEVPTNKVDNQIVSHKDFINRLVQLNYVTSYRLISEECQIALFSAEKKSK